MSSGHAAAQHLRELVRLRRVRDRIEPTQQPYGIRDCSFRDPAGNVICIQELHNG
jgi:hypothetical protein